MESGILSTASSGFNYLQSIIATMSGTGIWLMAVTFAFCIIIASLSSKFWPSFLKRMSFLEKFNIEWMENKDTGGVLVFAMYFLLFPIWSIFAKDINAWWLFLLFGWGMVVVIFIAWSAMKEAEKEIGMHQRRSKPRE